MKNFAAISATWAGALLFSVPVLAGELTLSIKTDKATYLFAEPIVLSVKVTNETGNAYVISTVPFYMLAGTLDIKPPAGPKVISVRRYGQIPRDIRPSMVTLGPGESYTVTANLRDHYPEYRGGPGGSARSLDMPGTYMMSAAYDHVDDARYAPQTLEGIFIGPLESNVVKFTIKPLEGSQLDALLEQLEHGDTEAKIEALNLLRRGERVDKIRDVIQYLNMEHPKDVRVAAALAISNRPVAAELKTYVSYVDDYKLSTLMVRSLEVLGTKDAADALYEVTDPELHPNCYGAAFGALVRMNDPRVDEVAVRLEKAAPDEWVRKFASDQLKKTTQK